jgi:hypothetical protein
MKRKKIILFIHTKFYTSLFNQVYYYLLKMFWVQEILINWEIRIPFACAAGILDGSSVVVGEIEITPLGEYYLTFGCLKSIIIY